jgi:predicted ATPase
MSNRLTRLEVKNFRPLENVAIDIGSLNVLFGPNGAGKSSLLDTIWFVRDCAIRGVDEASSERDHGIGILWDGANRGANISIKLESQLAKYELLFGYSSGRIEAFVGETLTSKDRDIKLIDRKIGSDKTVFYHNKLSAITFTLREPEKLALTSYLYLEENSPIEAEELDKLLHFVHFYHSRHLNLYRLRKQGSKSSHHTKLWGRGENLWSVLRNLHDKRYFDERYETILDFMKKSFPSFKELLIEQTGPNVVYGNFIEKGRRDPIGASGVSDGHLQMLLLLTALFSEGKFRESLILFDEPEISLHPYALAIFAEAVELATKEWNKQVLIATHSPVLMSQFEPEDIFAVEIGDAGETRITQVSQMNDIKDILDEYAIGSLYMAEMIAPQSQL